MKYDDRHRTRHQFRLTGLEHRGGRAGNERLVCHVAEQRGLLAIWGTAGLDMRHIDELEQALIFEKFYRGRDTRGSVQGTGMGLAIAKAVLDAHGGSIRVTSQPGQGSVFSIMLPLTREAALSG